MTYTLKFTPTTSKALAQYKKSNPKLFKKLAKLLDELIEHPRTGLGHPEPLRKGNDVTYSRRISAHDRLIYDIYDEIVMVLIVAVGGHYDDK